jgi:ATP/maltotriose-dependent transcriptional regulator MalT
MKTLKMLVVLIFWLVFNQNSISAEIKLKSNYSTEQVQIINNASKKPYFLIAYQLKYLYPKTFIVSGLNALTQNIALSFITSSTKPIYLKYFQNNLLANADLESIKALNYVYLGLYKSSIFHYEKALGLLDDNNSRINHIIVYKNLAHLYYSQKDLIGALNHNELLIKIAKQTSNNQLLISSLIFKANILLRKGEIKQAENTILKTALLINNGFNGKRKEQACFLQLGKIYLQAKKYTQAKWFFILSLTLSNQLNLNEQKIESLLLLAKVKNIIKDYSLASSDLKLVKKLLQNGYSIYQNDYYLQLAQTNSYLRRLK